MSQNDFAESIGISRATLSQIELENQKPTLETLKQIAINHNIAYEYFFEDSNTLIKKANQSHQDDQPNQKEVIKNFLKDKNISKKHFYEVTGLSNGFLDHGKSMTVESLKTILEHYPELKNSPLIYIDPAPPNNHMTGLPYIQNELFVYLREKDETIMQLSNKLGALEQKLQNFKKYGCHTVHADPIKP